MKGADEKYCNECAAAINVKAEICPQCGVRQMPLLSVALANNGKSRIATALLAFFFGGFGVHKFYLGQVGRGLLYLLFFWTVIPSIIALIECIVFLVMSDDEFNRKYG